MWCGEINCRITRVPTSFWHLLKHDALIQAWVFEPIVTIVVWSDFLRNKTDRKLTVMPQTYPDLIKKLLSQRIQMSCKECKFCRNPIDCYVWVVRGVIGKILVHRLIYIFEGSYWRALCLSRNTSVLRLLRYFVI